MDKYALIVEGIQVTAVAIAVPCWVIALIGLLALCLLTVVIGRNYRQVMVEEDGVFPALYIFTFIFFCVSCSIAMIPTLIAIHVPLWEWLAVTAVETLAALVYYRKEIPGEWAKLREQFKA